MAVTLDATLSGATSNNYRHEHGGGVTNIPGGGDWIALGEEEPGSLLCHPLARNFDLAAGVQQRSV